ncbi:hypothetical protein CHS0354_038137 [Potamilus streckersoni]|uniref:F-box/LRR-repeat protein 2 n=1 Tax=Potamilus streckersoni TaxID=2493646 RepID=A0AAE0SJH9_9BIVA|nr:hypothetical protein CHS0354_038137 [Potamilus streckersoni]
MPKRKEVRKLKSVCLRSIAKNIDKLWSKDFNKYFAEMPHLLYVIGPFHYFTNSLIQELLDTMDEMNCLKKSHFHLLFTPVITSLDLSHSRAVAGRDNIIKILQWQSWRLTHLNLSHLNGIASQTLADLVRALPQLQALNLSVTKCNDQVLSVLGHHCRHLRELSVVSCCSVSDAGAFSLSGVSNSPGCAELIYLNLDGTNVTVNGAVYLLNHLTNLQHFSFYNVCGALEALHKQRDQGIVSNNGCTMTKVFQLRNLLLFGSMQDLNVSSVQFSINSCPFVTEVKFVNVGDDFLGPLKDLKHLRVLELCGIHRDQLTFQNGVLPILASVGHSILSLTLDGINDIDLWLIGLQCVNLEEFVIRIEEGLYNEINFPSHTQPKKLITSAFLKLRRWTMFIGTGISNLSKEMLQIFLTNARHLTYLVFSGIDVFNTAVLSGVLQHNPLEDLELLKVENCNQLTPDLIWHLLKGENSLTSVSLLNCREISLSDCNSFQRFADKNNFDLKVHFI